MCIACFAEHWEDRNPQGFVDNLPRARQEAVSAAVSALHAYPGVRYHNGVPEAVYGPLHAAVEDDNYDLDAMRRHPDDSHPTHRNDAFWAEYENPESRAAFDAWDALSEDERSIACARFWGYRWGER